MKEIIIALVAIALLNSCHRCRKARHYTVRESTYNYQPAIGAGSYFIYRNVADTTEVDTFAVVQAYDSMWFHFAEAHCDGNYFQQRGFQMKGSGSADSARVSISATVTTDEYSISGQLHGYGIISYYAVSGGKIEVSDYWGDSVISIPSYTIAGRTYNNVVCVSLHQYRTSHSPIRYYYAPGIGLIQFCTYDEEYAEVKDTYQLVDYSIR